MHLAVDSSWVRRVFAVLSSSKVWRLPIEALWYALLDNQSDPQIEANAIAQFKN